VPGRRRRRGDQSECRPENEEVPGARHGTQRSVDILVSTVLQLLVFFHFLVSIALVGLILMHSGRDTGMAGMGYVPQSQGGTHIVEKNLTRLTIVFGAIFFINTVLLYRLLA
jgi:preprotein translocase subunit SecG